MKMSVLPPYDAFRAIRHITLHQTNILQQQHRQQFPLMSERQITDVPTSDFTLCNERQDVCVILFLVVSHYLLLQ